MILAQTNHWTLRSATPADNARLCELVRSIHMKGKLDVTQERDPDFFALARMHLGQAETWVVEDETGSVEGCGSIFLRDALLDGAKVCTGYMCDLRFSPKLRGGLILGEVSRAVMRHARDVHGAELLHDVVFDTNTIARGALAKRTAKRKPIAVHTPMTPFHMTSIQLTSKMDAPGRTITRGRENDLADLTEFLRREHAQRTLGYCVDDVLLRDRFRVWPGFSIENFFLSRNAHGAIDGCLAPWNTAPFKRTRVLGYHAEMRVVRAAYDLRARIRGSRPLPNPGEHFDFSYLTHMTIRNDDPAILRDLLLAAYRVLLPTRQHFMSAMVPRGSALAGAFKGFTLNRTPMTLYGVSDESSRWSEAKIRSLRPGFEMALS